MTTFSSVSQEFLVLGAQAVIGGAATLAFTPFNPLLGVLYGITLYAVSAIAHHALKNFKISPEIRMMIHVAAAIPAAALTAGILALIGVPIAMGALVQVAAAVVLGTAAFFVAIFAVRCLRFVLFWAFLNLIDTL